VSCSVVLSNRIDVFQPSPYKDKLITYCFTILNIEPLYRIIREARGLMIFVFCLIRLCRFDYSYRIIVFVKSHEPYCLAAFWPMFILHNTSIVIAHLFLGSRMVVLQVELMKCLLEAWALS
jgi:hypothetical protein